MGNVCRYPIINKEEAEKNKNINKQLAEEKKRLENEVKLLLLGKC